MTERVQALILDLDGVVIWRPPYQKDATANYRKEGLNIYTPPQDISNLKRQICNQKLSLKDWGFFLFHTMRFVYPDVADTLPQIKWVEKFGSTGRFDNPSWVWLTELQLKLGRIPPSTFCEIHYRPKGISTRDSKLGYAGEILKMYQKIRVVDDNPADLLPILRKFGDRVDGVLIEDRSTNYLLAEIDRRDYPTLRVVPRFRDSVQDLLRQAA